MSALEQAIAHLKATYEQNNKPELWTNREMAELSGYNVTTVSNAMNKLWRLGELDRVEAGIWRYPANTSVPEDGEQEPKPGNPATVAALDHLQDEKHWFEIKQTRATESPAGYTYHTITTRDGRTGVIVWDA